MFQCHTTLLKISKFIHRGFLRQITSVLRLITLSARISSVIQSLKGLLTIHFILIDVIMSDFDSLLCRVARGSFLWPMEFGLYLLPLGSILN